MSFEAGKQFDQQQKEQINNFKNEIVDIKNKLNLIQESMSTAIH